MSQPDIDLDELAQLEAYLAEVEDAPAEGNAEAEPQVEAEAAPAPAPTPAPAPAPAPAAESKSAAQVIKPIIDADRLKTDLNINPNDLQTGFMTQAGLFSWYAEKAAQAARQADRAKQRRDIIYAKLAQKIRTQAAEAGVKVTEAAIEEQVRISNEYVNACTQYYDAQMIEKLAESAVEAFRQRRDMLVQLGAMSREELKGQLRMSGPDSTSARAEGLRNRMNAA